MGLGEYISNKLKPNQRPINKQATPVKATSAKITKQCQVTKTEKRIEMNLTGNDSSASATAKVFCNKLDTSGIISYPYQNKKWHQYQNQKWHQYQNQK